MVTALDGYQMARQGRAGVALATAALGSFCRLRGHVPARGRSSHHWRRSHSSLGPGVFSLMVLGLIAAVVLAHGSVIKAIGMIILGLLLGLVGTDVNSGHGAFQFQHSGCPTASVVCIAMGVFGFAEIIKTSSRARNASVHQQGDFAVADDAGREGLMGAVVRGTSLGSLLGILPGGGAILASFPAYTLEKKLQRTPRSLAKAIFAAWRPGAANNAAAQTSFIPLLTLGIPPNPVMALMVGAMIIQGIQPGPQVMTR